MPDPAASVSLWPLGIFAISIGFIIVTIVFVRLHAFLALIMAAVLVGLLTPAGQIAPSSGHAVSANSLVQTIQLTTLEFGHTVGKVGLVIALASIIGLCLMQSGAADKIVRRILSVLGEKRTGVALLSSGYFLSIPVFFDTVFFLLVPLAKALRIRSGKDFIFYVMAICGGGVLTHSLVAPTPGPLIMAAELNIDLGLTIVAGFAAGLIPAVFVLRLARFLNSRLDIPLREVSGSSLDQLESILKKRDEELPSFTLSISPIVIPVVLIATASLFSTISMNFSEGNALFDRANHWVQFFGEKNIAMMIGTFLAMGLLKRHQNLSFSALSRAMGPPLESAGVIILITSAGGAFGAMLVKADVGDAIKAVAENHQINLIVLAWSVAFVMKVAQGSGTVAMITTSAIIHGIAGDYSSLPFHPIYLFFAIGFGSLGISWMNDSGFWIVGKLSGFRDDETLKTWTVMLTSLAIIGLVQTLLLSAVFPHPMSGVTP